MSSAQPQDEGHGLRFDQEASLDWLDEELKGCKFKDKRIGHRVRTLILQLSLKPGGSIPLACQDWASTKAAYRFFDNDRVDEGEILEGHFQATRRRLPQTTDPILVLHDTTEFSFKRGSTEAIGKTGTTIVGKQRDGRHRLHTICGLLMHSSLVVTSEGLPLGLSAVKFWTRDKFKGTKALNRKINATRVPIEKKESVRWLDNVRQSTSQLGIPSRCVHIGDREADIYEFFCLAAEQETHFVIRTCTDRLAGDGKHRVSSEMEEVRCKGLHRVDVRDRNGCVSKAVVELRYRRIRILPPIGKQSRYPSLELTVLHAKERGTPKGRKPIDWKLVTDLPIRSRAEAIEKLSWYALRWRIETFHKILKSGCHAEKLKLRTADRIVHLLAIFCILGWRIFWLTMMKREARPASPNLVFTALEIKLLSRTATTHGSLGNKRRASLDDCLIQLARLGGYLNRSSDGPPGNTVIWRGMSRLTDIAIGFQLAAGGNCG